MFRKRNRIIFLIIISFALIGLACSGITIQMDQSDETAQAIVSVTETPSVENTILTILPFVIPQNPNSTETEWLEVTMLPAVLPQLPVNLFNTGILGIDIGLGDGIDRTYTWYDSGIYCGGTSQDLDHLYGYGTCKSCVYTLPPGKSPQNIIDIAIYDFYRVLYYYIDGTVSVGTFKDADEVKGMQTYSLPPGKSPGDIVGISSTCNHPLEEAVVYVWYKDETVSSGTYLNLDHYRAPYQYSLPPGKTPVDIISIGIACTDDHVYVWYWDKTVSSGDSSDLDLYRDPQPFVSP